MKNLHILSIVSLFFACTPSAPKVVKSVERSIGSHSNEDLKEFKWHLGTDEQIDLVKALQKARTDRDFVSMQNYFVDTLKITTYNRKIFNFSRFSRV